MSTRIGRLTHITKAIWKSAAACLAMSACLASAPLALIVLDMKTPQVDHLPKGWRLKVNHGSPDIAVIGESDSRVLRFKSQKASFALERNVDIDVGQLPYITWRWKVSQLPAGGDFRRSSTDDQAAQVIIAFADRRVLVYLWDTSAPKGTSRADNSIPFLHVFFTVSQSGQEQLNQWVPETHNLAEDYRKAFGRGPGHVEGMRLQINSQHTGTWAESYFGDVSFHSMPQ